MFNINFFFNLLNFLGMGSGIFEDIMSILDSLFRKCFGYEVLSFLL